MADKRDSKRKIKRLPITFLCEGDEYKGISSNFSYTGLFIKVRKDFNTGSSIKMVLALDENRKIALRGVIVRVKITSRFDRHNKGIGIKLTEAPQSYKEFLEDIIKKESCDL